MCVTIHGKKAATIFSSNRRFLHRRTNIPRSLQIFSPPFARQNIEIGSSEGSTRLTLFFRGTQPCNRNNFFLRSSVVETGARFLLFVQSYPAFPKQIAFNIKNFLGHANIYNKVFFCYNASHLREMLWMDAGAVGGRASPGLGMKEAPIIGNFFLKKILLATEGGLESGQMDV